MSVVRTEHAENAERANRAEHAGSAERVNHAEHAGSEERANRAEHAGSEERANRAEHAGSEERANCANRAYREERVADGERIVWLDWVRVAACFMVMLIHCTEPFFLGGEGALIASSSDAIWVGIFEGVASACVPLFVIASSYLLFPLAEGDTLRFFKRRARRILPGLLLWSLIYAFVYGQPAENLKGLLLNFNYAAGHLWFVYMLVGLYILMPLLSPWASKVSKRELQIYLAIWLFTTLIPIIRDAALGGELTIIYGPTGVPRQALYPLWGEASWNSYGLFYYFSGFVGYLLLGLYFKRFTDTLSWRRTLSIALPLMAVGFAIHFGGFIQRVFFVDDSCAPVLEGGLELGIRWQTTWGNDTIGVVLLTIGWILLFRKIKDADNPFFRYVIKPTSQAGYGIYLSHMLLLVPISAIFREIILFGETAPFGETAAFGGVFATPLAIVLGAVATFICTSAAVILFRRCISFIKGAWICKRGVGYAKGGVGYAKGASHKS